MVDFLSVTKKYGSYEALHGVTFHLPRGRIIGLLGQNGAGKTTVLKLLTGYFPPTSGQILLNGMDLQEEPRSCKRLIGFLPEKPPLYDEMTVREYLHFVSSLREVHPKDIAAHAEDIMGLCGLTEVADRLLGHLSKGYRQRAGIAQALCGAPPLLVLDEPTVGLDPKQVSEIRRLIRRLGDEHTIILSSHILSEIQQVCDRVIILHKGSIAREMDLHEAASGGMTIRLTCAAEAGTLIPALKRLPAIRGVKAQPHGQKGITELLLDCSGTYGEPQREIFSLLCTLGAPILSMVPEEESLETVFLRATEE